MMKISQQLIKEMQSSLLNTEGDRLIAMVTKNYCQLTVWSLVFRQYNTYIALDILSLLP